MNTPLVLAVISAYLLLLVGLGLLFRKLNRDGSDYFRSGCRASWWLVGSSIFMAGVSAKTFTGNAGVAYESGLTIMVHYVGSAGAAIMQALLLAHLFRQTRAMTFAEIVRDRFGVATQQFYAFLTILLNLLIAGVWLWGLAIFVGAVFDLNPRLMIVLLGCVVLFYSVAGGTWAVMATDFVQGVLMVVMTALLAGLCLVAVGGVDGLLDKINQAGLDRAYTFVKAAPDPDRADPYQYTLPWIIASLTFVFFMNASLTTAPRFFAVKTGRQARGAALMAAVLGLSTVALFFIPPMTARVLFAERVAEMPLSKPAEAAFAVASMELLPPTLLGLMVVAMFAATMSSMDTGLNRNAAFVVRDIVPAIARRMGKTAPTGRAELRLGQAFTLGFGAAVVALALIYQQMDGLGMFELGLHIGAMLALPLGVPLVMGIIIRTTPPWSAMISAIFALLPNAWAFGGWIGGGGPVPYHWKVAMAMTLGVSSFLLTTLWWPRTKPADRERINAFFKRMKTPIDFEREVGEANDGLQLRVLGMALMVVAGFVAALVVAPQSLADRGAVLLVATALLAVGTPMWLVGRRRSARGHAAAPENPPSRPTEHR